MPTSDSRKRKAADARAALRLSVQYAAGSAELPGRGWLRRRVSRAAQLELEVVLRFIGAAEGRRLNRDFRGKDYATNVLTFVYDRTRTRAAGDIVICVPVLRREAREQKKSFAAHCTHLVVHGVLHLQGFDHEVEREAGIMERLETEIVTSFGYDKPYLH